MSAHARTAARSECGSASQQRRARRHFERAHIDPIRNDVLGPGRNDVHERPLFWRKEGNPYDVPGVWSPSPAVYIDHDESSSAQRTNSPRGEFTEASRKQQACGKATREHALLEAQRVHASRARQPEHERCVAHRRLRQAQKKDAPRRERKLSAAGRQGKIPAATYSPTRKPCSTIGSEGLNFRVRDGNGWDPFDKATGNFADAQAANCRAERRLCRARALVYSIR